MERSHPRHSFTALENAQISVDKDESRELVIKYLDGKDNGIAVLGLNRPTARNALGKNLVDYLKEAIASIKDDNRLRVLIIRSLVPKIFCAGADLRERLKMDSADVPQFVSSLRNLINDIELLPTPVISAIDGAGGTQRLPRIIGPAKAKELIYTARILDGEQAMKVGLVNQVVMQNKNGDAAYEAALSIAREILPNGPIGVKMAKVAISKGIEVPIEDGFEVERQCYAKVVDTKDRLEGLAAFVAKRAPIYRGT
ncbi:hypothetical protein KM043_011360 [Ampulex compressa]|nr:hypothetical protein KM043_011360 [Ampulex compressa]